MSTTSPSLNGYPIDHRLRDRRAVVTPFRTSVHRWLRRATGTA